MRLKLRDRLSKFSVDASVAVVFVCVLSAPLFAQSTAPSTDGVASASDRFDASATMPPVSSALPDRPMAITGEPVMMPPNAFANATSEQESAIRTEPSGAGAKSSARARTPKHAR
jgi:hypothetical protein